MPKLKVDLHTHTGDDPQDVVHYDALRLIDQAARLGYDAIAITNHNRVTDDDHIRAYARDRDILLIPGMEATLSGKHVVILKPTLKDNFQDRTLEQLPELVTESSLVFAPHPYFPHLKSLQDQCTEYISSLHAIEFSHFYSRLINFNKKAVETARAHSRPLLGTSDCHTLWEFGTTYSIVEAEKDVDSIIEAVKQGKVELVTTPLKPWQMFFILSKLSEVKFFQILPGLRPRPPHPRPDDDRPSLE
jgi:predicted metal-dependent phosphoesterase TrpH